MKKLIAMALTCAMVVSLAACGSKPAVSQGDASESKTESTSSEEQPLGAAKSATPTGPVELEVVTTFAGNDSNAQNYKNA